MSGDGERDGGFGGRIPWALRASLLSDQLFVRVFECFVVCPE